MFPQLFQLEGPKKANRDNHRKYGAGSHPPGTDMGCEASVTVALKPVLLTFPVFSGGTIADKPLFLQPISDKLKFVQS